MLVGIYALIINQSLKQKEQKNNSRQGNMDMQRSAMKPDNNMYFGVMFHSNSKQNSVEKRYFPRETRHSPVKLYKDESFVPAGFSYNAIAGQ